MIRFLQLTDKQSPSLSCKHPSASWHLLIIGYFLKHTLTTIIIWEYQFIMQTHGLVSRSYKPARMLGYQEKRV